MFNLGATLYWALTGQNIPTLYTVNKKGDNSFLLHSAIESPAALNPNIPLPLSHLTMEMIATRPQKRPADMEQIIQRLELVRHVQARNAAADNAATRGTADPPPSAV